MPIQVVPAIPASQIVSDVPSVLAAGGTGILLNGLMLTANSRVPIGTLLSFADAQDAATYFGALTQEAALASIYFLGFDNSQTKPEELFYYQYPWLNSVNAYLRGGSLAGMTLAQLQALSGGSLTVTIDGTPQTATNVNLSAATSFANAGNILAASLGTLGPGQGSYVGAISGTTLTVTAVNNGPVAALITGSIATTTLTVTAVASGTIAVGNLVVGAGITANTTILSFISGSGGVGTYQLSNSMTVASEAITAYSPANLAVGEVLSSGSITPGTYIAALISGTGGTGTYTISPTQTAASGTFTAASPSVYFDAVSQAFVVQSGTLGSGSTITFATNSLATSLALTQAAGAVISQGAVQGTPATIMNQIVALSTNWAQFMTLFEPTDPDKEGFAIWVNGQNNRYAYTMVDTNIVNTQSGAASSAVASIALNGYSAVSMIYENPAIDSMGEIGAFILGYGASIDFAQTQGRATAAFKSQSGLAPQVFNGTIAQNLLNKGMNFYGDYTTANQAFIWYYNGSVTGKFEWLDSYLNQIWYNSNLQLAGMVLFQNTRSIPFNQFGAGLIQAALLDPTLAAVNAGVIQPGVTLSAAQAAEVNASAGIAIDGVLSTRGWYIQVRIPSAQVRQARGPWPVNVWYTDGQAVQTITINSILIQ